MVLEKPEIKSATPYKASYYYLASTHLGRSVYKLLTTYVNACNLDIFTLQAKQNLSLKSQTLEPYLEHK